MPLPISNDPPATLLHDLTYDAAYKSHPSFIIVYASLTDGRSWCGDCRAAEPLVNEVFATLPGAVQVVYAGVREEWRDPSNAWRNEPFSITRLPTVVKIQKDGKWELLEEEDVYNETKLCAFVRK